MFTVILSGVTIENVIAPLTTLLNSVMWNVPAYAVPVPFTVVVKLPMSAACPPLPVHVPVRVLRSELALSIQGGDDGLAGLIHEPVRFGAAAIAPALTNDAAPSAATRAAMAAAVLPHSHRRPPRRPPESPKMPISSPESKPSQARGRV